MKKLRLSYLTFLMLYILLFSFSCSKDNEIQNVKRPETEKYFVDLSTVKKIATLVSLADFSDQEYVKHTKSSTERIKDIFEFKHENGKTLLYVINYSAGGYIFLSADKRTKPILGFSLVGYFNFNKYALPSGLKYWIQDTEEQICEIQNSGMEQSNLIKKIWEYFQKSHSKLLKSTNNEPPEDCYEHEEIYTKGPITSAVWHQTSGFNAALSYITCNGFNFQVLAGCAPVAMAQIMRYYQYPTGYNWSSMPLTYATTTTANFIKTIHEKIDEVYIGQPYYSCNATAISQDANMGLVLKNKFSYSSAIWSNYNCDSVQENIEDNKPVILCGFDSSEGHMWVCDGYRTYKYYFDDCTATTSLYFYMKWGWGGSYDGWYGYNNFNPGNYTFNTNKTMIYNIEP